MLHKKILIVDHYDSFTFNLAQALGVFAEIRIVPHDQVSLEECLNFKPTHFVFSPGPGTPEKKEDFNLAAEILSFMDKEYKDEKNNMDIPVLGVCLGHQGLLHHYGAKISMAPEPRHGKLSSITHKGGPLFEGIKSPMSVMRYHSLCVQKEDLPDAFEAEAFSEDGVLMAVNHKFRPFFGVQFHPESIGTLGGDILMRNFLFTKKL